ncbi:MFS transporter [Cellulomonas gilvus]|uniref:Major facilitator superfamily MFS_1 n=1 Tax=Cellulomonas gilvus (strain ATCC 13127 / NRRL B-14078) TaxID=593907 RepID=F8A5A6_CELGA|nr:MFS transporter [Cellulomonas gilvus]AEI10923.1 major facilitator superfamily MFS_1 [Cellulomonas gilvus ATCC 13127]
MSPGASRARRADEIAFAAQGYALTTILASLPVVQDRYDISEDQLTLAVLGVLLAAAGGSGVADWISRRPGGSRVALAAGLLAIAGTLPLVALAPTFVLAVVAFALYGVALGMVDAGTNMQGVAVQRVYGRPLMSGFHAGWSVGAIIGALVCAATVMWLPSDPVILILLTGVPVALVAGLVMLRDGLVVDTAPGVEHTGEKPPVPWGPLLVLGGALLAFYAADNAAQTWGSLYVDETLEAEAWLGPLTLAAYLFTALLPRLFGDAAVRRWGRVRVVRTASLVAAAGLLVVVVAPGIGLGLAGFAIAGAGLGLGAPLCFSAAGALSPDDADAVVARLNVFNYGGTLMGAVLVGVISGMSSFRWGFLVPVVLVLGITAIAGRFSVHDDADAEQARRREVEA